ncbi:PAAR domain-containing protein [Achromobacter animicus]|uniref:PAAR domain-containing protein n=1 Tax=Achromobacter animicus TaxID=1389935 RepID=UPI00391806A6
MWTCCWRCCRPSSTAAAQGSVARGAERPRRQESSANLHGRPMAGVGHRVSCPKCKGVFPIVEGSATYKVNGIPVALHGMMTACGARLLARDHPPD